MRLAVISYNPEYGVVVSFFSRGESVSEPILLSLKENLHTKGKERVREDARDRQKESVWRRKQRSPFQSFRGSLRW